MAAVDSTELDGGRVMVHVWPNPDARYIALLSHGYGEHARRYDHVAGRLVDSGAVVYAPDHMGHGRSQGERALVTDVSQLSHDLHQVEQRARGERFEQHLYEDARHEVFNETNRDEVLDDVVSFILRALDDGR